MDGGIIGRRYAKALISLAGGNKDIEGIGNELQVVADCYIESDELRNIISEPKISKSQKADVVNQLTQKLESSELVNKYCRYLTYRNRFDLIADIASAYESLASEKLGKASAKVIVAKKIAQKDETSLKKELSSYIGKDITLSVEIDESILGGAITSIESLVLDGSIKNKLNLIRETISKGN